MQICTKHVYKIGRQTDIQGFPQRMRFQRRLYGICTVSFLVFTFPATKNFFLIFAKPLNNTFQGHTSGRRPYSNFESLYFKSFKSSLLSHPIWITCIYIEEIWHLLH